jgi:TetR/AcrR family transcriptional repressor of mexJK operon
VRKKTVAAETPHSLNERLLKAAVEVFLEKGFVAASVDEIAARAKASKITFYNHYGNKEALFEAVIRRQNAALLKTMGGTIRDDFPLENLLTEFARRIHALFLEKDTVKMVRVLHAEADRFPQLASVFEHAGPSHAIETLAAELERRMANGSLRKADPVLAAEQFLHLALGELTRRVLLGLRPPLSKAETSKRIASGIDVFLRAYRA